MADDEDRAKYDPLSATGKDRALTVGRAAVSAVPYVGGPLAELADLLRSPLEKRREPWGQEIAEGLRRLEARVESLDPERLGDNPAFVSVMAQATQAAIKTHDQEKLQALRNAVLNAALALPTEKPWSACARRSHHGT
jgi:hypothetical protein